MGVASRRPASPVSGLRIPVGPLGGFFRRLIAVHEFALAMARMSDLTASGNVGQAAINASKSAPTAPDSAAPVADKVVFPENSIEGSIPLSSTFPCGSRPQDAADPGKTEVFF